MRSRAAAPLAMNDYFHLLWKAAPGRFCVTSDIARNRWRAITRRGAQHLMSAAPGLVVLAACVALAWSAPA